MGTPAPAGPDGGSARTVTRGPVRPAVVAAVIAVGQLCWFTVELLRGYFWQDDFNFYYLGATEQLGELLLRGYNGHLQPGTFLVSWVMARLAPMDYEAAVMPVVVLQALSLLLCWRLLVRLFGERWEILVPFTMVACSPLTFGLSMWWAYALALLPIQLAVLGALNAHAAYLASPSRWRAAQGFLFTAFGLAFWEKALLIPPLLFGLTLVLADGALRERLSHVVRRHAKLWLGYVVACAAYLVVHFVFVPGEEGGRAPGPGDLLRLTVELVGDSLLPAVFGGPWSGNWLGFRSLAPQEPFVLALVWALTLVVVFTGLRLGRLRAALAWCVVAGYLAASVLMVAVTRLGEWEAIVGTDPRYIADALPVVAVFGGLALLQPRDAGGTPAPPAPRNVVIGCLLAVFALVAGSVASIALALPEQRHEAARNYVANVRAAIQLYPDLVLYDDRVPQEVLIALLGGEPYVSKVLGPLDLRVDQPTGDLRMLDSTGTPHPIGLVDAVGAEPGPIDGCGYLVGTSQTRIELTRQVTGSRRVVNIGYYTTVGSDGAVTLPTGTFDVKFEQGLHRQYVVVDGPFDELLVRAGSKVCITDVVVGSPLPDLNR